MAAFPRLKTGAVTQYPSRLNIDFRTEVLQFLDGKEQRFRSYSTSQKRWLISLSSLDEAEVQEIVQFVIEQSGKAGVFSFTDPWDGAVYENCSIEQDEVFISATSAQSCQMELVVLNHQS